MGSVVKMSIGSIKKVARKCGLTGLITIIVCWVVAGILSVLWHPVWPTWAQTVASALGSIVFSGIPMVSGVLVAFWIVVAVWSRILDPKPIDRTEDDQSEG